MKSPVARKRVVLQYQEISSGFGIEHQFNETFKGTVNAGGVFNRRLEYKDGVGKVAPETGFYTSLQLKATFNPDFQIRNPNLVSQRLIRQ